MKKRYTSVCRCIRDIYQMRWISCLCLVFSFQLAHSQWSDTTYAFSTFELPDIKYRSLTFRGDLDGSSYRYDDSGFLPSNTYSDFGIGGDLGYYAFQNSRSKQFTHSLNFYTALSWDRSDRTEIDRILRISPRLSGNSQLRWYSGNDFTEFSLLHSTSIDPLFHRDNEIYTNQLSASTHLRPVLLTGKGRIEPISLVAIAHFLIEDLARAGLLTERISNKELNALGQHMARSTFQRVFDVREERKYQISQIDSMIQSHGWVNGYSIDYFTILADNWLYDLFQSRSQGKRFSYGIAPHIYYRHSSTTRERNNQVILETENNSRIAALRALVRFTRENPLSISKQRYHGWELSAGYDIFNSDDQFIGSDAFEGQGPAGTLSGYYGFGFFPNSRTIWRNTISASFDAQSLIDEEIGYAIQLQLSSTINYFLSPRARLTGGLNLSWIEADDFYTPTLINQQYEFFSGIPLLVNVPIDQLYGHIGASLDLNFVYQIY